MKNLWLNFVYQIARLRWHSGKTLERHLSTSSVTDNLYLPTFILKRQTRAKVIVTQSCSKWISHLLYLSVFSNCLLNMISFLANELLCTCIHVSCLLSSTAFTRLLICCVRLWFRWQTFEIWSMHTVIKSAWNGILTHENMPSEGSRFSFWLTIQQCNT